MSLIRHHLVACMFVAGVVALLCSGCDSSGGAGNSEMDQFVTQMDQSKQAEARAAAEAQAKAAAEAEKKAAAEEAKRAQEEAARLAAQNAAPAQPQGQPLSVTITVNNPEALMNNPAARAEAERMTAGGATVGQGGSYYDAIIGANRSIRTRTDDLAWTQAVQHYWAENGRYPKSHDEFMQVMEAQGIPLPELDEGQEYFYAPPGSELAEGQFGTLYILEPKPAATQPTPPPATEPGP